jgi:hypothetical protein
LFYIIEYYVFVSPLKYIVAPNGSVAGTTKFQRTLYVPAGNIDPIGTSTSIAALPKSGIPSENILLVQGLDDPTSTVILVNVFPTPASGIQIL